MIQSAWIRIKHAAKITWIPIAAGLVFLLACLVWLIARQKMAIESGPGALRHMVDDVRVRIAEANRKAALELYSVRERDDAVIVAIARIEATEPDHMKRLTRLMELRQSLEMGE